MKVHRILEIIIYLINHDHVPASYLAERFHVSVRTIQRDIISISSIGIPVYAEGGQKVFWDFGVTKENNQVQTINKLLEQAIAERKHITFDYRNAGGEKSKPCVEPLAIHYKWYAWYLFSYSPEKKQYRTYKVARIQNLHINDTRSSIDHGNIEMLMKDSEKAYYQTCIPIEVQFNNENINLMSEYFPNCQPEKLTESISRIFIHVPAKERLWKALLLSFGDKVKVIGPEEYKKDLIETAQNFLSNYDIQMSQ